MEDLKSAVIYLIAKGKKKIAEEDFVKIFSYDTGWIPPDYARRLFRACLDAKLLQKKNEHYEPAFEIRTISLPLDFRISTDDVDRYTTNVDVFTLILDHITKKMKISRRDALMEINKIKRDVKYITIDVASLIYCKEKSLDCTQYYDMVEKKLVM